MKRTLIELHPYRLTAGIHAAIFSLAGNAIHGKQSNYEQLPMSMADDPRVCQGCAASVRKMQHVSSPLELTFFLNKDEKS